MRKKRADLIKNQRLRTKRYIFDIFERVTYFSFYGCLLCEITYFSFLP